MSELTPVTREEMYLDEIADALENGGGGGGAAVYNATITIQKNGTKVDDFTANQRTDKTINITIPTSAADVSALPASTKYAAALSLTINSSTFVVTGQLKDQNGDNLGTAQTIDLPLESVVVGGSYNSQTKKVVLTLQNGNTIEFSVADLVSGLQTELSASNKLNPAYIDYDSTHRAVSDTEKSTWSGKQDALSSSQLSAVNSGIDSTKVAQIATNENNILTAYGGIVGKNLVKQNTVTFTGNNYTIDCNNITGVLALYVGDCTSTDTDASTCALVLNYTDSTSSLSLTINRGESTVIENIDIDSKTLSTITIYPSDSWSHSSGDTATFTDIMICSQANYTADSSYQPYVMSNAEITAWILSQA